MFSKHDVCHISTGTEKSTTATLTSQLSKVFRTNTKVLKTKLAAPEEPVYSETLWNWEVTEFNKCKVQLGLMENWPGIIKSRNRLGESVGNKTFGTDNSLVSVCHPLLVTMLSNNHVSDTDPWTEMKMLAWISTGYTGSQFPTGLQNFKSYCI